MILSRPVSQHLDTLFTEMALVCVRLRDALTEPIADRRDFLPPLERFRQILQTTRPLVAQSDRTHRATKESAGADAHKAARHTRHLRNCCRMAVRLADVLGRIGLGVDLPIYPTPLPRHDLRATHLQTLDQILLALHRVTTPDQQSPQAADLGCFPDIALRASSFAAHAHAAYRLALAQGKTRGVRFLDVGCGSGLKVLAAADFFATAEGLDYDPAYVEAANTVFAKTGAARCRAFEANARTFSGYDSYDILYFYRPMKEHAGLAAMETQLVSHARPGTILIAPYAAFALRADELPIAPIAGELYLVGPPAEAEGLRDATLRIGPDVLHPDTSYSGPRVDWLEALWWACVANGFVTE